jgi:hypothetical protein
MTDHLSRAQRPRPTLLFSRAPRFERTLDQPPWSDEGDDVDLSMVSLVDRARALRNIDAWLFVVLAIDIVAWLGTIVLVIGQASGR